jgi:glucose/arabinose dehydrogenase
MAVLPDGRILACEQGGRLIALDAGQTAPTILATLTTAACRDSETGLLGIAVDPDFTDSGFVYLYLTRPTALDPCEPEGRVNEVVRYFLAPGTVLDFNSKLVLVTGIRTDTGYHCGGGLAFGKDKTLYIGTGDTGTGDFTGGGPGGAENPYAQDLTCLEGKILRLHRDGSIPVDNPFVNTSGARPEIYARGFRNAFRLAADPKHGPVLAIDVGEDDYEELDIVKPGGNYAWPRMEGFEPLTNREPGDVSPVFAYGHFDDERLGWAASAVAIAPLTFAHYAGRLFFADFGSGAIYSFAMKPGSQGIVGKPEAFAFDCGGPVDLRFGPNPGGAPGTSLYYVAFDYGEIRRITPETSSLEQPVKGTFLRLRGAPKKSLVLRSIDAVDLGSPGDMPTAAGATLRVRGAGFDDTYALPAARWKAAGKLPGNVKGFTYADPKRESGPVVSAAVLGGKLVRVQASGDLLGHEISAADPSPVHVDLTLGTNKLCLEFANPSAFQPEKSLTVKGSPAPASCPP